MTEQMDPWAGDCLDRKKFGDLLLACLQAEAAFCEEAFVVALTGKFGSGKSFFLDMWVKDLLLKVKEDPAAFPMVVTVNAWESDFSGEPLLALVSAISTQVTATRDGKVEESVRELKRGLAGAVGVAKWALSGLIEEKTGVAPEEVIKAFEGGSSGEELDRRANALLSDFNARKRSLEKLRSSLRSLIESHPAAEERELKLLIVVDELDRCHPRYAIEFLEAIKHVFNVKGLAVILGVDWGQLCCTASAFFGQNLDTAEYFRKFVKRRVRLPQSTDAGMRLLAENFFSTYLSNHRSDNSPWSLVIQQDQEPHYLLGALFSSLNMTPRQGDAAVHLLGFYYRTTGRGANTRYFFVDFFLACLAVANPALFEEVLSSKGDPTSVLEFVVGLKIPERMGRYYDGEAIEARIVASLMTDQNAEDFKSKAAKVGFRLAITEGGRTNETALGELLSQGSGFPRAYAHKFAKRLAELGDFLGNGR